MATGKHFIGSTLFQEPVFAAPLETKPFLEVPENLPLPPERKYAVRKDLGVFDFTGRLLAQSSTYDKNTNFENWIELRLYRITKGPNTGIFVFSKNGCSNVYHRVDGDCDRGKVTPVKSVPSHGRACRKCKPLPHPGTMVRMEQPLPHAYPCSTVEEIIGHMRTPRTAYATAAGDISRVGMSLLYEAAAHDADILHVMSASESI